MTNKMLDESLHRRQICWQVDKKMGGFLMLWYGIKKSEKASTKLCAFGSYQYLDVTKNENKNISWLF